jgi:antitoxin component YwqK of YwqJK toxin-antitoxin module
MPTQGEYDEAGERHGRWVTFYADGAKRSEGTFDHGVKHGKWVLYWPNGKKQSVATFDHGKYTGKYVCYHVNGNKKWEGRYNPIRGDSADGTKDGVWKCYQSDGKTVWRIITYKRGSRTKPDEILAEKDH